MPKTHIRTFLSVCDCGSFTKAAEQLYTTPSSVLQQIRSLEEELGVKLFFRSPKGVTLTRAGEYLKYKGGLMVEMYEEIRRDLANLSEERKSICIGTSMMEKCRLLYDLWVLFSEEEKEYGIRMVNIDADHNIPFETELIESVNSNVGWMREWEFLEICRIPFGFAFVNEHPLAKKQIIRLEDLRGETVTSINEGSCDAVMMILDLLRKNRINVTFQDDFGVNMFWESAFRREVQLVPLCWNDILFNMTVVPFEREFLLPYGIFYRSQPHPATQKFLDFIRKTYTEGNARGIVPVLT